jgi:hypothetical protein
MATHRRAPPRNSPAARLPPMVRLQNRWYNCLTDELSLDRTMFQIVQPSGPMVPTDDALWAWLDTIPPASLSFNRSILDAGRFFDEYASMVSQIRFPQTALEQEIGEQNYQAWSAYLAAQRPTPPANQFPQLFQGWAARNAPAVAAAGVAFLSRRIVTDAIRQALATYQGPNAKPADFTGTYADLLRTLDASSGITVFFDSSVASDDVIATWTRGIDLSLDGLWAGSGGDALLTRKFAASRVTVSATFDAYAQWVATPGPWYSSSLLNIAYSSHATPLWLPDANPSWTDLFGSEGSLLRLVASLVVVDGSDITITSDALFNAIDQAKIVEHQRLGMWPVYAPTLGSAVSNAVTFPRGGGMKLKIATQGGNPLVIGANILGIARYLGHAVG